MGCSELRLWWEVRCDGAADGGGVYVAIVFGILEFIFVGRRLFCMRRRSTRCRSGWRHGAVAGVSAGLRDLMAGTLLSIIPVVILFFCVAEDFIAGLASGR